MEQILVASENPFLQGTYKDKFDSSSMRGGFVMAEESKNSDLFESNYLKKVFNFVTGKSLSNSITITYGYSDQDLRENRDISCISNNILTFNESVSMIYHLPNVAVSIPTSLTNSSVDIEIRDSRAIRKFILIHPEVEDYIERSKSTIPKYFPDSKLSLEIVTDPDSNTGFEEAFLRIETNKSVKESLSNLTKIYNEIFIDPGKDRSTFNITIE